MVWDGSLVGDSNPFEKYAPVKLDHFPRVRDENKTCLKPPLVAMEDKNKYGLG